MVNLKKNAARLVVLAVASCMLFLLFCGRDSLFNKPESQAYGQVSPVLLFKKGAKTIIVPQSVDSIRMHIIGTTLDTSVTVLYLAHQAEMQKIPVGIVQLVVDGLDSLGQVIYTGSISVTIEANVVAQPQIDLISTHPIVLTFTSPHDNETVATKSITLSGTITSEYGLLTFKIGQSEVAVTGDQWTRNVELQDGPNPFVFVAIDNKLLVLRDTLTVMYSATARDTAGPAIILLQPADSSTVPVTPITIMGTVTDPSGILAVQVNRKTATLSGSTFSINEDLIPGKNTIIITAIDNSPIQNKSSDTFTVTLNTAAKDTVGPIFAINTPRNGDTVATATVMVSGSVLDISGVASVTVNTATATITNNTWSASIPVIAGQNRIVVAAIDASPQNNVSRDSIVIVYSATAQDKTLPAVAITSPSINTVVSNPLNITVSGNATDPAGIASVKVNGLSAAYSSGTWSAVISLVNPGNNAVWAVATDGAGNKDSTSINLIYDSTAADVVPPSITLVSHVKGSTVSVSPVLIQITATDANGIVWVTINGDTATLNAGKYEKSIPLVNGVNQIRVVAQDKSPNKNIDSLTFSLTYDPTAADTTPPKITLATLTPGQVVSAKNVLIQVTATDANGIARVTIQGDSAVLNAGKYQKSVVLVSGLNTIRVVAQDASLKKNIDSLVFTLNCDTTAADNTPPTITFSSPTPGQKVAMQPALVQVIVSDQNGVALVTIAGDTALAVAGKYQRMVNLTQGNNSITIVAEDASPNHNKGQQNLDVIYDSTLADSTPPRITLVSPTDSQVVATATVRIQVSASDPNGIFLVTLNGDSISRNGALYETNKTLIPGVNPFKVYAIDASPNHNRGMLNFTLIYDSTASDTIPPAIRLISPADSQIVNISTIQVKATVTDYNGVYSVTINSNTPTVVGNDYTTNLLLAPGQNQINIIATDASRKKNQNRVAARVFFNPPPESAVLATPTNVTFSSLTLSWSRSTDNDFASYKVFHSTAANVSLSDSLDTTITDVSVTAFTVGRLRENTTYYFKVFTTDKFPSTTPSNEVSVKTSVLPPPVVTVTSPGMLRDSALVSNATVMISGTASSAINITSVTAVVNGSAVTVSGTSTWDFAATLILLKWNPVTITATDGRGTAVQKTVWLFYKQPLGQPNFPGIDSITNSKARVFWSAVPYCSTYSVYRSNSGATGYYACIASGLTGTSYMDTGLAVATRYWYTIRGFYSYPSGFNTSDSTSKSPNNMCQTKFWFQKTYGAVGGYPTTGASVVVAPDKGYYLWGTANDIGTYSFYFAKTDSLGTIKVEHTASTGWNNIATFARLTGDGGFIGVGYSQAATNKPWAYLYDASGSLSKIGTSANYNAKLYSVVQTPDNGFIATGTMFVTATGNYDVYICKMDATLNVVREIWYGGPVNDCGYSITATNDGNYIIAGQTGTAVDTADVYLLKITSAGDTIWTRTLPGSQLDYAVQILSNADGSFTVYGGEWPNYTWLWLFDSVGTLRDLVGYNTAQNFNPTSFVKLSDGSYVFAANYGNSPATTIPWLVKRPGFAGTTWAQQYGHGDDYVNSVVQTPDGGFVMLGTTNSFGGGSSKMWLIKADFDGVTSYGP
jgi:hypothetical protein